MNWDSAKAQQAILRLTKVITLKYRIKVPVLFINFGLKFLWYGNIFHKNIALINRLKIGMSCMSEHPFTISNLKNLLFCVN